MRKYRKFTIFSIAALLISVILKAGFMFFSTDITIYLGIRMLNSLNTAGLFLLGGSALSSVAALGLEVSGKLKEYKQEVIIDVTPETPTLSMKGRLDPPQIKKQLNETLIPWCNALSQQLIEYLNTQFEQMDAQQERLHSLLENNGAMALGDTEDILDTVEQNMCKRIRNLINILSVYDPSDTEKHSVVISEIKKCIAENRTLLDSAQDFMLAVANYLNTQNTSDDMDELNIYKQALLNEIDKAGMQ